MAIVYPGKGKEAETAKRLLELAGDRRAEVRTTSETAQGTGSIAFIVPDAVAEAYTGDSGDDETETAPRRRGRPPRKAQTTDNPES